MRTIPIAALLLGGGLLLVILSLIAPYWRSGRQAWTESLAVQFQQASQNYHAALHASAHRHAEQEGEDRVSLETARQAYERYQTQLEAAQTSGSRTALLLRRLGMLGCVVGFVAYCLGRYMRGEGSS